MNTFFVADPHFGHKAILKYENRPFSSVEEMDELMIKNWNSVVGRDDRVYLLGDVSFHKRNDTWNIIRRLKGNIYLVMGNHDGGSIRSYYDIGFDRVYDCPIIYNEFWMLSHEPLYINENMPYANIFGHVHSNKEYKDFSSQSFCVSVERINYTPIEFSEIKQKMGIQ